MWTKIRTCLLLSAALCKLGLAADPWGYHEDRADQAGPSHWADLNAQCGGTHQSPINLEYEGDAIVNLWGQTDIAPIKYIGDCEQFNLKTLEDIYRWEIRGDSACKATLPLQGGKNYTLAQFHVHTPSEHTIYGHHYNGEIHFVHKEDGGSGVLVTGLLLNVKPDVPENAWIENVWETMNNADESTPEPVDLQLNYADVLNAVVAKSHLFNYKGSLTTPPCSEIVDWWVINNPLLISESEFDRLKEKLRDRPATAKGHNNRPTQDLNDRQVSYW